MILHATEAGAGEPVLLLHGLFGQARNLGVVQRHLSATRRVVAMDLRNHGASPHAAGMTYADMADDVRETARAKGVWPATVIGHSMGGKVAMRLALDAPDEVTRVAVLDIAPVPYPPKFEGIARAMAGLMWREGMTRRDADEALAADVPDAALRGFLLQNFSVAAPGGWRIGLAGITGALADIEGFEPRGRYDGPALFITGGRSSYVRDADVVAIGTLFPGALVVTCKDAGHWLHAEDPACVCAHLDMFFRLARPVGG